MADLEAALERVVMSLDVHDQAHQILRLEVEIRRLQHLVAVATRYAERQARREGRTPTTAVAGRPPGFPTEWWPLDYQLALARDWAEAQPDGPGAMYRLDPDGGRSQLLPPDLHEEAAASARRGRGKEDPMGGEGGEGGTFRFRWAAPPLLVPAVPEAAAVQVADPGPPQYGDVWGDPAGQRPWAYVPFDATDSEPWLSLSPADVGDRWQARSQLPPGLTLLFRGGEGGTW